MTTKVIRSVYPVTANAEEGQLQQALRGGAPNSVDPKRGLFGPGSMFWEVNRHTLVSFLSAVQSLQMQLCHPGLASTVYEYSKTMADPCRRAQATYNYLLSDKARSVLSSQGQIQALLWAQISAIYCKVKLYQQLIKPLSEREKDEFCQESIVHGEQGGLSQQLLPRSWQEVEDYVDTMSVSNSLVKTEEGLQVRMFLEKTLPLPVRGSLWNFICAPLPERMQALLDQPMATPRNLGRARKVARRLKWLNRLLPDKLANVPAYQQTLQRDSVKSQPHWLTSRMNRLFIGGNILPN